MEKDFLDEEIQRRYKVYYGNKNKIGLVKGYKRKKLNGKLEMIKPWEDIKIKQKNIITQNERIVIRRSGPEDLVFVQEQESAADNAPYVGQWSEEQHRSAMRDPDCGHWIIEVKGTGKPAGYAILRGLQNPHGSMEFMRIVISEKKKGLGRETLRLVKQVVFEQLGAHRLWLDVREHNVRAKNLYLSEGFVLEGILRECQKWGENYSNLLILSLLDREWRAQM